VGFLLVTWLALPHTLAGIAFGALGAAAAALIGTAVLVGLRLRRPVAERQPERGTLSIG
jgi:hypothetical protein